ncbi:MAG: hypothetical protein WC602_06305 [archaeon]
MNDDYACVFGCEFDKKFKKAFKKHRCVENDFNDLKKTIFANFENTRLTIQISGLGEEYSSKKVFKTHMMITELRSKDARLVWHPCCERRQMLFIDVYLKNMQENHDADLIKRSLDSYYETNLK